MRRSAVDNRKPKKLKLDISKGAIVSLLGKEIYWKSQSSEYYDIMQFPLRYPEIKYRGHKHQRTQAPENTYAVGINLRKSPFLLKRIKGKKNMRRH